jgi:hypothetical protein
VTPLRHRANQRGGGDPMRALQGTEWLLLLHLKDLESPAPDASAVRRARAGKGGPEGRLRHASADRLSCWAVVSSISDADPARTRRVRVHQPGVPQQHGPLVTAAETTSDVVLRRAVKSQTFSVHR